jgi:hypothetical protein
VGHIVVFEGADRVPAYHRCDELADAVSFAEKLRNDRGVDQVQILRTEEIRFDFKPYYRIELGPAPATPSPAVEVTPLAAVLPPPPAMSPIAAPPPAAQAAEERVTVDDIDAYDDGDDLSVGSGVRRGLFGR